MCGIVGFSRRASFGQRELATMLDRITYRGPDDSGTHIDSDIALGNALLAIVDVGNGHQPFHGDWQGEPHVAVFNGEIYNYRALRKDLTAEGWEFTTDCDTEVALAAVAIWGEQAVTRFDGQWALAVWKPGRRQLLLFRDPFGIKPLFYHHQNGSLTFASEPKAIFALPDVPKRPNEDALREYFLHGFTFAAGYCSNHRSFYDGIDALPPGCLLRWSPGREPETVRYFDYPLAPPLRGSELRDASDMLRATMSRSTVASMMGDAPIGVALSGGLDSSVITTIMAQTNASREKPPLLASCITYRSQNRNEDADHAKLLVDSLGPESPVNLVFSEMAAGSYLRDLDTMIDHFGEPHWEVKQLAMFNNYRALKANGAKVVLTGEGADELFFGYYHKFPGFKSPVIRSTDELRAAWSARLRPVLQLLSDTSEAQLRGLQEEAIDRYYRPVAATGADPERCMQCWYLATFLHWLLIDNDRCSMAFSLEGRFPFLNRDVFELAFRIPPSAQIGAAHGEEKLVLRRAFSQSLPEQIWRHRRKAPLPSPLKLSFHQTVRDALTVAVDEAVPDAWQVVSRDGASRILDAYAARIETLERSRSFDEGGEELTRYLRLDEPWSVRTPHVFGLLTFLRWWKLNFA